MFYSPVTSYSSVKGFYRSCLCASPGIQLCFWWTQLFCSSENASDTTLHGDCRCCPTYNFSTWIDQHQVKVVRKIVPET